MSKEYDWAWRSPDEIVAIATSGWKPDAVMEPYESVIQVAEAFKERMMSSTLSHEAHLQVGHPHPWYLDVAFTGITDEDKPFIISALRHYFESKDEMGGTIFPIDQIRFAGNWIFVFGDIERANEITPWPWSMAD